MVTNLDEKLEVDILRLRSRPLRLLALPTCLQIDPLKIPTVRSNVNERTTSWASHAKRRHSDRDRRTKTYHVSAPCRSTSRASAAQLKASSSGEDEARVFQGGSLSSRIVCGIVPRRFHGPSPISVDVCAEVFRSDGSRCSERSYRFVVVMMAGPAH